MLRLYTLIVVLIAGINSFPAETDTTSTEATTTSTTTTTTTTTTTEQPSSSSTAEGSSTDEAVSETTTASTTTTTSGPPNFFKYRWDAEQEKYIRLGTTDNCPENMRFFAVPNNGTAGVCDCDYYQCTRPLLYSPKTKSCHYAWSTGPCEKNEWYAFDHDLRPICEERQCPEGLSEEPVTSQSVTLSYWFTDPNGDDGECHEASSDETCQNEGESLLLYPGDPIPRCRQTTVCVPLARPEPQLCFKGNKRYFEGLCE